MKKIHLVVVLAFLILSSCANALSGNSEKERKLFQQIKAGMKKNEVEKILGKPDYANPSSEKDYYYYYFTKSKSGMRSEMPYVLFDSTGVVKFATYGDGG